MFSTAYTPIPLLAYIFCYQQTFSSNYCPLQLATFCYSQLISAVANSLFVVMAQNILFVLKGDVGDDRAPAWRAVSIPYLVFDVVRSCHKAVFLFSSILGSCYDICVVNVVPI